MTAGRAGHGRWGAEVYGGAARVECRHEALAVGERCRVVGGALVSHRPWGRHPAGWACAPLGGSLCLGEAAVLGLWSAIHGHRAGAAGADKYSACAGAVLVLGRYYSGVPLYRLEGYQAMVGVPV